MNQHPVQLQIERADKAIVAEDFDVLMDIYTDDAVLVVKPGRNAVGKSEIRKAFGAIAGYFKNGLQVEQNGMEILESGDTALVRRVSGYHLGYHFFYTSGSVLLNKVAHNTYEPPGYQ